MYVRNAGTRLYQRRSQGLSRDGSWSPMVVSFTILVYHRTPDSHCEETPGNVHATVHTIINELLAFYVYCSDGVWIQINSLFVQNIAEIRVLTNYVIE